MKKIDQWETESMDKIRMVADDVRKQLLSALDNHTTKITEDLKHLTKELTTARSEKKYLEMDLKKWMEKLEKCTSELRTSPSINLQYDQNRTPFIRKIVVNLRNMNFSTEWLGI
jgi:chromosome segregation ATPase